MSIKLRQKTTLTTDIGTFFLSKFDIGTNFRKMVLLSLLLAKLIAIYYFYFKI